MVSDYYSSLRYARMCSLFIFFFSLTDHRNLEHVESLSIVGSSIHALITKSLASGCVPAAFKHVVVQPLIMTKCPDFSSSLTSG